MRCLSLPLAALLTLSCSVATAQFRQADPQGPPTGETKVQRMQAGLTVRAVGGPCRGIVGYMAVPTDWPEQQVQIVDEDVSPSARVSYQMVDGMAQQMTVRIPNLAPGEEARVLITFEVRRSTVLPPTDTEQYVLPDQRSLPVDVRRCLGESPKIETRDRRIRALAREIGADAPNAWARVEAIYDWVRDNVEYKNGPLKGAVAALEDKTGDCEELTSLFVAICRAADIPARTVWVEGHCYPEFYLADAEGEGHWFPCQAAGTRSFGGIPELRPVLQKGDNIRPSYNRHDRQRYLANHLTGAGGRPQVRFVRKMLND